MRWGFAGFTGLMLAGCGPQAGAGAEPPPAEHTVDPATGEIRMTIPHKGAAATLISGPGVPVVLPDGLTLFPGTEVTDNARFARADGEGSLVTFRVAAPPDEVAAHYRRAAEAAGFAMTLEHEAAGSLLLVGERGRDGARLALTVTSGAPTTGQLVVSAFPPR